MSEQLVANGDTQTSLNKLKAQLMKARLRKAPNPFQALQDSVPCEELERDYESRLEAHEDRQEAARPAKISKPQGDPVVKNDKASLKRKMEADDNASVAEMMRQVRGFKDGPGADALLAQSIARDGKFTNSLEYLDENANKFAKGPLKAFKHNSQAHNLTDECPLCFEEDTNTQPEAPVVSLGVRSYLTLPPSPEITPYGLCATIVPFQHHRSLLECDDDEWDEIRNFMKSLSRFYYAQRPQYSVVFYENSAHRRRPGHAVMQAVPLPLRVVDTASGFFREAILAADEEWTQHRKLIDTGARATKDGLGKLAFRRSMVPELPYFHVWLTLDGGLGHVVEDERRWPKGDLFARQTLGGILDRDTSSIRDTGKWQRNDPDMRKKVTAFEKIWTKWDWTHEIPKTTD